MISAKIYHTKSCKCSICSNALREERQYAAWEYTPGEHAIIDAEEFAHINEYMTTKEETEPVYEEVPVSLETRPVMAYGVLIPQYDVKNVNWSHELQKHKYYEFGTLKDKKVYISEYTDFVLYEEDKIYDTNIPVALLLNTSLDLKEQKQYGFGYTSFLLYKEMDTLSNILNRRYILCLGDIGKDLTEDQLREWKNHINKETLIKTAERLY